MISYISGLVKYKTENSLIVLVQGLGYEVFLNSKSIAQNNLGEEVEFFIYQNVKEDSLTLFGFNDYAELNLFKKLISVSGIGPKSAMAILEIASVNEIISSIQNNDPQLLTKVSGVGKKTAERVVLELRNKLDFTGTDSGSQDTVVVSADDIDALISLGYSTAQARDALRLVSNEITDISQRIKEALKYLAK